MKTLIVQQFSIFDLLSNSSVLFSALEDKERLSLPSHQPTLNLSYLGIIFSPKKRATVYESLTSVFIGSIPVIIRLTRGLKYVSAQLFLAPPYIHKKKYWRQFKNEKAVNPKYEKYAVVQKPDTSTAII